MLTHTATKDMMDFMLKGQVAMSCRDILRILCNVPRLVSQPTISTPHIDLSKIHLLHLSTELYFTPNYRVELLSPKLLMPSDKPPWIDIAYLLKELLFTYEYPRDIVNIENSSIKSLGKIHQLRCIIIEELGS